MDKYFYNPARFFVFVLCFLSICLAGLGYAWSGMDGLLTRASGITLIICIVGLILARIVYHRTTRALTLYLLNGLVCGSVAVLSTVLLAVFDGVEPGPGNGVFVNLAMLTTVTAALIAYHSARKELSNSTSFNIKMSIWFADRAMAPSPSKRDQEKWTAVARWCVAFAPLIGQSLMRNFDLWKLPVEMLFFVWAFIASLGTGFQLAHFSRISQLEIEHRVRFQVQLQQHAP